VRFVYSLRRVGLSSSMAMGLNLRSECPPSGRDAEPILDKGGSTLGGSGRFSPKGRPAVVSRVGALSSGLRAVRGFERSAVRGYCSGGRFGLGDGRQLRGRR